MSRLNPREIEGFDVMARASRIMDVPIHDPNPQISKVPRGINIEFDQETVVFEGLTYIGSRRTYSSNGLPIARLTSYKPPSGRDLWLKGIPRRVLNMSYELTGVDDGDLVSLRTEVASRVTTPHEEWTHSLEEPGLVKEYTLLIQRDGMIFSGDNLPLEEHVRMQDLFSLPK